MSEILERRTYKETYFWVFVICLILTVLMEHYGISVDQVTNYTEGIVKKTFNNINYIMMWAIPVIIAIKNEISKWREAKYKRDVEIEKIKRGRLTDEVSE